MALHCPECGFLNAEGANYCQKCGAFLGAAGGAPGDTTIGYQIDETGELKPVDVERVAAEGFSFTQLDQLAVEHLLGAR